MATSRSSSGDTARIAALVSAQAATRASLAAKAAALAATSGRRFTQWYDTDAITEWATKLSGQMESILRVLAQSTDAYLARVMSDLTGSRMRPVGRVDVTSLRQGISHADAYARAADVWRYQQSRFDVVSRGLARGVVGDPPAIVQPVDAAVERLQAVTQMDTQLAVRAQSQAVMVEGHRRGIVSGYRRVIHPELSKGGTCGLCVAASDRVYHVEELMPIHDKCECSTIQILGDRDVGDHLNAADLKQLYEAAGSTAATDLKRTRYRVDQHSELGPILVPHDAADRRHRPRGEPRAPMDLARKLALLEKTRSQLSDAMPKAMELAAANPSKWGEYLRNLEGRVSQLEKDLAALR